MPLTKTIPKATRNKLMIEVGWEVSFDGDERVFKKITVLGDVEVNLRQLRSISCYILEIVCDFLLQTVFINLKVVMTP